MTHTLLIRIVGPMQAWGVQSRFNQREILTEPSKSGVIGLLCAALGKPREECPEHAARWPMLDELAALKMAVRVDRPGSMRVDYHTVKDLLPADADLEKPVDPDREPGKLNTNLTYRYYLTDAWFTVALEGERSLLRRIEEAVQNPHWPLALGRRALPLSAPLHIPGGLFQQPAHEALLLPSFTDPYWTLFDPEDAERFAPKRLVLEDHIDLEDKGWRCVASPMRPDQPVSFQPRQFSPRTVYVYVPEDPNQAYDVSL